MSSISLNYVADDPGTQVDRLYIESIRNPRAFSRQGARGAQARSRSSCSSRAALGRAPRPPPLIPARPLPMTGISTPRCDEHGLARAEDEDDFLNALRALAMLPRPRGKRVAIATTSGALGVVATDLIAQAGLELARFAPATLTAMRSILPDWLPPANPFDFWIGIDVKGPREAHEVGSQRRLLRSQR